MLEDFVKPLEIGMTRVRTLLPEKNAVASSVISFEKVLGKNIGQLLIKADNRPDTEQYVQEPAKVWRETLPVMTAHTEDVRATPTSSPAVALTLEAQRPNGPKAKPFDYTPR